MKEKIIPFIKKYPMSILLAIIALNLFSISDTLKKNGKLDVHKSICVREDAFIYGDNEYTDKEYKAFRRSTARKIGIPLNQLNEYCSRIQGY